MSIIMSDLLRECSIVGGQLLYWPSWLLIVSQQFVGLMDAVEILSGH